MDLPRLLLGLLFVITSTIAQALTTAPNPGIVFVHGTNDHRDDADGGYWKKDFVSQMSQSLPNPDNSLVIACDYSKYMWEEDASGCTADQMLSFIDSRKITKLVVYTHSNGANVIRWILSHPTYDARFLKLHKLISRVVALAPSSGGTPLADEVIDGSIFTGSVGWLLGYRNNSVKQQRVGDMALFNAEVLLGAAGRPSLPVPFKIVVGTDVTASPFSSASYCNGYLLNTGLKLTKLYLERCSDGFLNCSSQVIAGTLWFFDTEKTSDQTPLSHSQSRHSCFGLEQILISDLAQQGV
ncbi:hypothetical protein Lbir_0178 [Legionella birminghamensis]|uniref:Lipase n=1 Tax=Legionella birminghamensis TaxID=28083 RepID=A0A378IAJ7_9GAMM|nr:hypothetical protein [Legionella birminghamensis]KTC76109.1 hypothetical protein Lbir_0178 [Legionella birminghamensis]STX32267.1 Uncharacterised protein [Legionella birminghamensis]